MAHLKLKRVSGICEEGCVHAKASCQVAKLVLTLREHIISPQATDPERP